MSGLAGKTAIVTGGGDGIGYGIVHRLAADGARIYRRPVTGDAKPSLRSLTSIQDLEGASSRQTLIKRKLSIGR